jgi:hypothetical protein
MKKVAGFVLGLLLSSGVMADNMAAIVKSVQTVCLSPAQQGKYWDVSVKGGIKADGSVRLVAAGINGEATFTKGEWEGMQRVLKKDQLDDNKRYTHCAEYITNLFLEKFAKKKEVENKIENSTITGKVNQAGGDINIIKGK